MRVFYCQSRDINHFLKSNNSVSRINYIRILALASLDLLFTLPIGIAIIALNVMQWVAAGSLPVFYPGWSYDHTDWEPESYRYEDVVAGGRSVVAQYYFIQWTSPALALIIFCLFGVTSAARASFWQCMSAAGGWLGWRPNPQANEQSPRPDTGQYRVQKAQRKYHEA